MSVEAVNIREFNTKSDISSFISLFNIVYHQNIDKEYFDWKYNRNPGGPCIMLVAEHPVQGIVGFAALTPYRIWLNGREGLCAQGADTMVHPDFRRKGIFTELTTRLLKELKKQNYLFRYSAPGTMSMPGYLNLGSSVLGFIPHKVRLNPLNYLLRKAGRKFPTPEPGEVARSREGWRMEVLTTADERLDRLDADLAGISKVRVRRDSSYLNWRFLENPIKRCSLVACLRRYELMGYAIIRKNYLSDILFGTDNSGLKWFVKSLVEYFDKLGIVSIEVWFRGERRIEADLKKNGFFDYRGAVLRKMLRLIPKYPLIVYPNPKIPMSHEAMRFDNWYITMGDIDCM